MLNYDKDKIVELRKARGWSGNRLAKEAKLAGPSVWAIERGRTQNVKAATLIAICNALQVPLTTVLKTTTVKGGTLEAELLHAFHDLDPKSQQAILAAAQAMRTKRK